MAECANRFRNEIHARRRGIVLMHDVHSKTIDMVEVMVPDLEAEGFQFARLDAVPKIAARIVKAARRCAWTLWDAIADVIEWR